MTTRVLILNDGADTGGGSIKIKQAFDKFAPGWEVRAVRRAGNYINYPADVEWPKRTAIPSVVLDLFAAADVVHMVHNENLSRLLPGYEAKPKILMFRGRGNNERIAAAQARGIACYVSTPNLLVPGTDWIPNIGDADALGAMREREWHRSTRRHPRLPLLVHAPTIRRLKGTDALLAALAPLAGRLDVEVIEGHPLDECLRRKAHGDLLFDQFDLLGGAYGSNAIEAWGLGMPVVNGEPNPWMRAWYERVMGYLPFAPATEATVAEVVTGLLDDPTAMEDVRDRGRQAFERFHEESMVVKRLIALYELALS